MTVSALAMPPSSHKPKLGSAIDVVQRAVLVYIAFALLAPPFCWRTGRILGLDAQAGRSAAAFSAGTPPDDKIHCKICFTSGTIPSLQYCGDISTLL
jgi:hypothetical protein